MELLWGKRLPFYMCSGVIFLCLFFSFTSYSWSLGSFLFSAVCVFLLMDFLSASFHSLMDSEDTQDYSYFREASAHACDHFNPSLVERTPHLTSFSAANELIVLHTSQSSFGLSLLGEGPPVILRSIRVENVGRVHLHMEP